MGDGANGLLGWYAAKGFRDNPNYVPRKRPRTNCPDCGKEVEASEGLRMHMKAKRCTIPMPLEKDNDDA